LSGLRVNSRGEIEAPRSIMAKISRPEVASAFLQPPPAHIVKDLVARGLVTETEARLGERLPTATELCVEADSGGHTDQGVAFALLPAMLALRDDAVRKYAYQDSIAVGAAGGIGTPQAAAAAFVMGADFVLTGSINQCTVESGASGAVKDILQTLSVQDTAYAPAGDMFELGAKVQVARRGLFFPARANKLFELYQRHSSLDEIDAATRRQIEEKYFKRSFDAVWRETVEHYGRSNPKLLEEAEQNPRRKMALIFKWYFVHSTRLALSGSEDQKVDYQIHCGPALGSFNAWVKGTDIEPWQQRRVGDIAQRILSGAAESLQRRVNTWMTRERVGVEAVHS
jgi:trans-AT polyketide synthase/acyltransferase/oxidoreductase domain-containing protein